MMDLTLVQSVIREGGLGAVAVFAIWVVSTQGKAREKRLEELLRLTLLALDHNTRALSILQSLFEDKR